MSDFLFFSPCVMIWNGNGSVEYHLVCWRFFSWPSFLRRWYWWCSFWMGFDWSGSSGDGHGG